MYKFLISTPLKESWKVYKNNIYLDYNTIFDKKKKNLDKRCEYLKPFATTLKERNKNEKFVNNLNKEILNDLTLKLNEYHGLNLSNRCWNIILGHCIKRIIKIIFYRYKCLENVLKSNKNLITTASHIDEYYLNPKDSYTLEYCTHDDEWNFNLISNILRISFNNKIKLLHHKTKNNFIKIRTNKKKKKWLNTFILNIIEKLANVFNKKNSYFIYNSYMSKFYEAKLNFFLGQIPTFKTIIDYKSLNHRFDKKKREILNLKRNNVSEVESVVRMLIPKIIPSCYLENFNILKKQVKELSWPESPKAIITANSYDFDEIFKIWTAFKVSKGSKYFIFQHGSLHSNYILKEMGNEYNTCDKFFYWGKKFNNKKGISAFNFKLTGKKENFEKKNEILVICKGRGHNNETYDRSYEHKIIFDNLMKFTKLLPKRILDNTYFRVKDDTKYRRLEKNYIKSEKLNIASHRKDIFELTKKKSLVIYFYNSTGIYENLSLNIPTMFLWADSKNLKNKQNKDFLSFCKKNKIFHQSVEKLVDDLILKFDKIDKWWGNKELQKSRKLICRRYSILPNDDKIFELSKKIKRACI